MRHSGRERGAARRAARCRFSRGPAQASARLDTGGSWATAVGTMGMAARQPTHECACGWPPGGLPARFLPWPPHLEPSSGRPPANSLRAWPAPPNRPHPPVSMGSSTLPSPRSVVITASNKSFSLVDLGQQGGRSELRITRGSCGRQAGRQGAGTRRQAGGQAGRQAGRRAGRQVGQQACAKRQAGGPASMRQKAGGRASKHAPKGRQVGKHACPIHPLLGRALQRVEGVTDEQRRPLECALQRRPVQVALLPARERWQVAGCAFVCV